MVGQGSQVALGNICQVNVWVDEWSEQQYKNLSWFP